MPDGINHTTEFPGLILHLLNPVHTVNCAKKMEVAVAASVRAELQLPAVNRENLQGARPEQTNAF